MEMGMQNFRKMEFTPPPLPYNQELESTTRGRRVQ